MKVIGNNKKHLWEEIHSFYCNLGNYYSNDCNSHYDSWDDFLLESEDEDFDLNLIFRWDWVEGESENAKEFNGDINYRNGILYLFYLSQRKGIYRWVEIEVCRADEEKIIKFLKLRWKHMYDLWKPISCENIDI